MEDIVDYSRKLKEESKRIKKNFIILSLVIAFFAFSLGFYFSYIFNSNNENDNSSKNKFDTIYSVLSEDWYYGKEYQNIDNAIYGMIHPEIDPFTRYGMPTSNAGLGIAVSEYKEYFLITDIVSKVNIDAGLKKGDILKSVDGVSLENKARDDIKALITDKDSVTVVVERDGVTIPEFKVYITNYTPVTVFKDFSDNETAYIRISEFESDTGKYFDNYLKEAKNLNYNKLIIDLRDNPGGYITSVVDCADLLLTKGKIVLTTKEKDGTTYSYKTSDDNKYDFSNITILINENSASGAEALAACLNQNEDSLVELVGVTTYGKGSAQKTIYFTDGTHFSYTYALWYTPNGETIHTKGVKPETEYIGNGLHTISFPNVTMKLKDYGQNVENLQVIMQKLGYYTGEINSYYTEELFDAVKEYQKDNNIEETGEFDKLTIRYVIAKYQDDKIKDYKNEVNQILNK